MNMGNLLIRAMRICGSQPIQWYAVTGTTKNAIALLVTTFADPVTVQASVQPMQRTLMQFLGLDANKEYLCIYTNSAILDLARDRGGDQIVYNGSRYQILNATEWQPVNGWSGMIAVKL